MPRSRSETNASWPDDDVIEQLDVEEAAGRQRLGGEVEIVGRGSRVARRVVVDEDGPRRVDPDGVAEELADPDERGGDVPLVDRHDLEDGVLGVEEHHPQLLALQVTHERHEPVGDVPRGPHRPAAGGPVGQEPPPELERGRQLGRLRDPDAGQVDELQLARTRQAGEAVVARERLLREVHRAEATGARAPDQRDQLRRRQAGHAARRQALAGALLGRDLADGTGMGA